MESIHVGLLGLGTVGSGVYKLLDSHKQELEFQLGGKLIVDKILVNSLDKERVIDGKVLDKSLFTTEANDIFNDKQIKIVIEVVGGEVQALDYMKRSLQASKSVVTANKDVLAKHGVELTQLAKVNHCDIYYEASVGGGIPIIRSLTEGLASDNITRILGIVNGTTNYILTKMSKEGMGYDQALSLAKELGFAEPDPTSDVEGFDAARKMVILSSLGFSMPMQLEDVYTRGISKIDIEDIEYSNKLGFTIKLIGYADIKDGEVEVSVQPTLLPDSHPLASVNNENNAVYLHGEAVGETMFYGPGAGSMPTATAIVSDVISVAKRIKLNITGQHMINFKNERKVKNDDKIEAKFYLRLNVKDEVGVLNEITRVFANERLSFESVLQKPTNNPDDASLIIITHKVILANYITALKKLEKLEVVNKVESSYRVFSD